MARLLEPSEAPAPRRCQKQLLHNHNSSGLVSENASPARTNREAEAAVRPLGERKDADVRGHDLFGAKDRPTPLEFGRAFAELI